MAVVVRTKWITKTQTLPSGKVRQVRVKVEEPVEGLEPILNRKIDKISGKPKILYTTLNKTLDENELLCIEKESLQVDYNPRARTLFVQVTEDN